MAEAEWKLSMMSTTGYSRNCSMFRYINSSEFVVEAVVCHQGLRFGCWIIASRETLIKNHNDIKIEAIPQSKQ